MDVGFDPMAVYDLTPTAIAILHWVPLDKNFALVGSAITRFGDQGAGPLDAELLMTFGQPIPVNRAFALYYNIIPPSGDPGSTGFTAYLTPIPEPATAVLLALAGWSG